MMRMSRGIRRAPPTTYATTRTASYAGPTTSRYHAKTTTARTLGQTAPPPPAPPRWGLVAGWTAVVLAATGLFYAVTEGIGTGRRVATNRKRRSSRLRKNSRRRSSGRSRRWVSRRSNTDALIMWGRGGTWNKAQANLLKRLSRQHPGVSFRLSATGRVRHNASGGISQWEFAVTRRARSSRRNPKLVGNLKRYKALSSAARRRMPDSSFALPGKRFPIKGPPGSSRERDKWQAMQAIRYLNMGRVGTKSDYLAVRNAVIRRYGAGFWRSYDGPSWAKVEQAKRRRRTTRGRRVRPTRRVAANKRRTSRNTGRPRWWNKAIYWGRDGAAYYVESPNRSVRLYRGQGAKRRAEKVASDLAQSYGLPRRKDDGRLRQWFEGRKPRRNPRRRVSRNARRKTRRRSSAQSRAGYAVSFIRRSGAPGTPRGPANLGMRRHAMLARRGAGLYRVSGGRSPSIVKFKRGTSMQGAMTNTRIASSASGEPHWLVKVYRSGRPKVVVVRHIGGDGKTRYRAEEYAKAIRQAAAAHRRAM